AAGRGSRRPPGSGHRRRRAGRAGRLRGGGQEPRHQPLPSRGGRAGRAWHPRRRRPGPVAGRGGPRPGDLHHRHQGQEQHNGCRGASADPVGLPLPGGGEHRPAAVGPGGAGARLRLLGDRDIQLPGDRPALLTAGGRGDLAAPGPPGLARRRGDVLPGQAVGLLSARGRPDRRERGQRPAAGAGGPARAAGGVVGADDDPGAGWMAPLGLLGVHNRRNALIARACLRALGVPQADDEAELAAAAAGFAPLPSRLEVIGEAGGVVFVDDSLSTNVLPTLAAMDAFPGRRVALIAGGHDRGIDYGPLAAGLAARDAPTLVLAVPDSGPRIQAAIEAESPGKVEVTACGDLASAVGRGYRWARPDGVVLLSLAAPSFGRFRDYRDRGEAFARAMRACTG